MEFANQEHPFAAMLISRSRGTYLIQLNCILFLFQYLYLIFSDDSLISFDEWVFNTEAHPLPVKGKNPLYREAPFYYYVSL